MLRIVGEMLISKGEYIPARDSLREAQRLFTIIGQNGDAQLAAGLGALAELGCGDTVSARRSYARFVDGYADTTGEDVSVELEWVLAKVGFALSQSLIASQHLARAYSAVQTRMQNMDDPRYRNSYRHEVKINRDIFNLWEGMRK